MANQNWNNTFLTQPTDENNPGYGAEGIRNTREGVDERAREDHFWGEPDESPNGETGGRHKEGSAVARVEDEDSTARESTGERVIHSRIGTVKIDMSLLGAGNWREIVGVEQSAEGGEYDNRKRQVTVFFEDADTLQSFANVFNPDKQVSTDWDQSIGGDKVFTRAVEAPADDDTAAVVAFPDDFNPAAAEYATNYLIPANVFWKWVHDAKFHNTFDSDDVDNANSIAADTTSPTGNVVTQNIEAQRIHGTVVTGLVYV